MAQLGQGRRRAGRFPPPPYPPTRRYLRFGRRSAAFYPPLPAPVTVSRRRRYRCRHLRLAASALPSASPAAARPPSLWRAGRGRQGGSWLQRAVRLRGHLPTGEGGGGSQSAGRAGSALWAGLRESGGAGSAGRGGAGAAGGRSLRGGRGGGGGAEAWGLGPGLGLGPGVRSGQWGLVQVGRSEG